MSRSRGLRSEPSPSTDLPGDPNVFLAQLKAGALGPRLAFSARGTVAVWADTSAEEPGLHAMALGRDGLPFPARRARVDKTARQLTLGFTNKGQILATTVHKKAGQEILTATRISAEGAFESLPQVLVTTPSAILYTKVVPTALGAVVVWVERTSEAADLYSIVIDEKGPRRATRQARAISAWQVVGRGGSIAVVTREGLESPSLMFRHLGDRGETIGAPIEIARHVSGAKDVDLAVNRDHILVSWSEAGPHHSRLKGSLLDASGNVTHAPFFLTAPRGDQALLGLAADEQSEHFHVLWREPLEAHHGRPSVFVGRLSSKAPVAAVRFRVNAARQDMLLPTFSSLGEDLALLTDFDCNSLGDDCAVPFERASAFLPANDTAPNGAPLRVGSRPATMAWDLLCAVDRCHYLMSEGTSLARVHLATLEGKHPLRLGIVESAQDEGPRLLSHETLAEIPELSKLKGVVAEGGGRSLLSWISYFQPDLPYVIPKVPAPDGRLAPLRARITTVEPPGKDESGGLETVISYRARSLGGVHLVAPRENRGLLLWSALDEGKPRLFATLVDAQGKKVGQRTLTKTSGEITDIVGVRVSGGYLLSWVDGTGDSPRLLSLRISDALIAVGNPRVVAERTTSPSGVTLLPTSAGVHCVWSDARDAGLEASTQLYGALLDASTAAPKGPERQLTRGTESAHAPRLVAGAEGEPVLAWISQTPDTFARLVVGTLNADGLLSKKSTDWSPESDVADFSIDCSSPGGCRVSVLVTQDEQVEASRVSLWALSLVSPGAATLRAQLVVPLWTSRTEGVSPVLVGDDVYFSDRAEDGSGWQLRRATIDWMTP